MGNLTAFGPFVTDFYLPCLPELASCFGVSASLIQVSLTTGMLGLAFGQLFVGPIADKFGRRRPLLWGLALFVLSTIGCMLSTSIAPFVFFRLLQGITGASGLVISKVIIADSCSAAELSKFYSVLAAVQGVAPVVAPVIGGLAFSLTSWQGAFAVLGLWCFALLLACRQLKETLPDDKRLTIPILKTFGCYAHVVRNHRYLAMNLLQGFTSATLIAYISASPFIFQSHFGLTPMEYGLCFAGNAVALVVGSAIVAKIGKLHRAAMWSAIVLFVTALLCSAALLFEWSMILFEVPLFMLLFAVGVMTPVAMTLALRSVDENLGVAAALLGAAPFLLGGIVAPLTGLGNMLHSMSLIITVCSLICVVLWSISHRYDYSIH